MLGKKSKISAAELLKNSLVSQDFSEAISEFSSSDFVSPFLEFAELESKEEATRKAQELLDVAKIISELNTEEASKVVDLLFRNRTELGGNVLHALTYDARFSPVNQLAVIEVLSNSTQLTYGLISEKDNQNATPIDFYVTFLDKDFNGFEQIGLLALDLELPIPDFLQHAMRHKNHDLVTAIYKHPNYQISVDEQIMYLVHREKFKEFYPAFATDEELLKFRCDHIYEPISNFIADELIKKEAKLLTPNAFGCPPIHLAAKFGYTETLKALIANGADVNAKDIDFRTPAHYAVSYKNNETLSCLIASGADVNTKNNQGKTPLHWVAESFNNIEILRALITYGADVNARDNQGRAPLHGAAIYGDTETLSALIASGAAVNAKDNQGKTPLHRVVEHFSNTENLMFLIAYGSDVNAIDNHGCTPLHGATFLGKNRAVELLINNGAIPTIELKQEVTNEHQNNKYNKEPYKKILEIFDKYFKQQELKAALSTQGSTSSNMLSSTAVTEVPNCAVVNLVEGVAEMFIGHISETKSAETAKGV